MVASHKSAEQLDNWLKKYRHRIVKPSLTGEKPKRKPQNGNYKQWQENKAKVANAKAACE